MVLLPTKIFEEVAEMAKALHGTLPDRARNTTCQLRSSTITEVKTIRRPRGQVEEVSGSYASELVNCTPRSQPARTTRR